VTANGFANAVVGSAAHSLTPSAEDGSQNFRFYDNRQKYLLFVNTTSEKLVVANRILRELKNLHPKPPAVRLFDAGVGDGSVLTRVMRAMHDRYPYMPFYVVGKEISLEDIRLTLRKLVDRFFEHPATVVVLTNLNYSDAPWLAMGSASMIWHEVRLQGSTASKFDRQITALEPFLSESWAVGVSPKTGNPTYKRPVALVLYRDDQKFLLDPLLPSPGGATAGYDLIIASQPYRARASLDFKVKRVLLPLTRALGPGGRLIGIQSHGNDPGAEIVRNVWPGDNPFIHDQQMILKSIGHELRGSGFNFNASLEADALFKYNLYTLPSELEGSIGTSTAFAAWNAAVYVSQVEDERLAEAVNDGRYLDATRDVLRKHGGLWFLDEAFVISRARK
jgi:hypothetical protein